MSSTAHVAWLRLSPRSGQNVGVNSLSFVADIGIEGDRHAKPDTRNQVLLMDTETLDALDLAPGDIRENVATSGIDLASLREGDRLRIGAEAEVVISHPCDPCSKMDALRPGLQEDIRGRRGMLGTVSASGVAVAGDPITVTAAAEA